MADPPRALTPLPASMGRVKHRAVASDLLGPMDQIDGLLPPYSAPVHTFQPQPSGFSFAGCGPQGCRQGMCLWVSTLCWPDVVGTVRGEAVQKEVEGLGYSAPIPLEFVTSPGTQMHKGNNPVSLTA